MTRPDRADLLASLPYDPDPLGVEEDDLVERRRRKPPRRQRLLAALGLALFFLGLALGHATAQTSRSSATVIPTTRTSDPEERPANRSTDSGGVSSSLILEPDLSTPIPRTAVEQPEGELRIVTPKPVVVLPASGVHGPASWYDDPRKAGLYAAAGPALRVGDWRGRTVTVCGAVCFAVVLSDFCGCPNGRVIDLSGNAFARLAPLSRGVIQVTVTW